MPQGAPSNARGNRTKEPHREAPEGTRKGPSGMEPVFPRARRPRPGVKTTASKQRDRVYVRRAVALVRFAVACAGTEKPPRAQR
jgi:hypothetical protein